LTESKDLKNHSLSSDLSTESIQDESTEEHLITVNKEELETLKTYRNICLNIRDNLEKIKNNQKITLLPERKAIYLSILDVAVNGPYLVEEQDAMIVLGVSENKMKKVKNIKIDTEPDFLTVPDSSSSRSRVAIKANDNQLLRKNSETNLKFGSAHRRSHQRAHSANTLLFNSDKKRDLSSMDGFAKRLREQFQNYSRHGDRKSDGQHITLSQSDKWLKQAKVIDGRIVTTTDSAITWRRMSKSHIWMNFVEWLSFIEEISEEKDLDIHQVREALVSCGKPKNSIIEFDTSKLMCRLTNINNYGHRHRSRFDANGNGLGTRDPRDLPVLWPAPSPEGFLSACPSVMGAGRSGATSPNAPRRFGYMDVCKI